MIPWDERYGAEGFFYGTEPNDFLREQCGAIRAGGEVLCLAEGEGRNAVFLAGQGYRVVALDQSAVGLRKAERLAAERGVSVATVVATSSAGNASSFSSRATAFGESSCWSTEMWSVSRMIMAARGPPARARAVVLLHAVAMLRR